MMKRKRMHKNKLEESFNRPKRKPTKVEERKMTD